jgi:hypothetical protein
MADSVEKKVFKDVVAVLGNITSVKTACFGTYEPDNVVRPSAAVVPLDDEPIETPTIKTFESIKFVVRTVVDKADEEAGYELLDVLADIDTAILTDPRRGGFAENTIKRSRRWLYLDKDWPQAGADTEYEAHIKTLTADPRQQV